MKVHNLSYNNCFMDIGWGSATLKTSFVLFKKQEKEKSESSLLNPNKQKKYWQNTYIFRYMHIISYKKTRR